MKGSLFAMVVVVIGICSKWSLFLRFVVATGRTESDGMVSNFLAYVTIECYVIS